MSLRTTLIACTLLLSSPASLLANSQDPEPNLCGQLNVSILNATSSHCTIVKSSQVAGTSPIPAIQNQLSPGEQQQFVMTQTFFGPDVYSSHFIFPMELYSILFMVWRLN